MLGKYFGKLLMVFAIELEKFEQRVTDLRREAIPGLSRELLTEWERDLGLPDICSPLAATIEERAQICHAKYTGNYYGQSKQFFIDYASKLGALITIQEYSGAGSVFRVDTNRVDRMPIVGIDGARLWSTTAKFRIKITIVSVNGNVSEQYIKCRLRQIAPAHIEIVWA
jgi:uncharacterized protein YmfQ (DUF2313 family)